MLLRSRLLLIAGIVATFIAAMPGAQRTVAAEQSADDPAWLKAHVGEADGQIAPVVLQRARALHLEKTKQGGSKYPC